LVWGIKASLIQYVEHTEDGQVTVSGGAERIPGTDNFRFAFLSADLSAQGHVVQAEYRGTINIRAYAGMLEVVVRDPLITFSGNGAAVFIESDLHRAERFPVAVGDLKMPNPGNGSGVWCQVPMRLTAEGASWLGEHYFLGQEVDPITFQPLELLNYTA
jgi:hypothetical protein